MRYVPRSEARWCFALFGFSPSPVLSANHVLTTCVLSVHLPLPSRLRRASSITIPCSSVTWTAGRPSFILRAVMACSTMLGQSGCCPSSWLCSRTSLSRALYSLNLCYRNHVVSQDWPGAETGHFSSATVSNHPRQHRIRQSGGPYRPYTVYTIIHWLLCSLSTSLPLPTCYRLLEHIPSRYSGS